MQLIAQEPICDMPVYDRVPELKNGAADFYRFLNENKKYPKKALKKSIETIINITFRINSVGKIDSINVKEKRGFGFDEEAIRLIKLSENMWLTCKDIQGNPDDSRFISVRIPFRLTNFEE